MIQDVLASVFRSTLILALSMWWICFSLLSFGLSYLCIFPEGGYQPADKFSSHLFRYDPSTGIYGMDFYVVLERPGYRVGRRKRAKSRVGIQHRVTKDDAMKWFQVKYEGVILNKSQVIS